MHQQDRREESNDSPANLSPLSFKTIRVGLQDKKKYLTDHHAGFLNDLLDVL